MKHLIICREYPPAPSGGIGTYAAHIAPLLAEAGETVHVIGQLWRDANREIEESHGGRLIVHRLPYQDWDADRPRFAPWDVTLSALFRSDFPPRAFAWQAGRLAERLVESEGIDLIEAQEYEAPLWFFQLRRALGMGPRRQPPCLVHLHSPTEPIAVHNEWDLTRPDVAAAVRLEEETIRAADALLCPSRFLARQAEERYGLDPENVRVIPLPLGGGRPLERPPEVWERGAICYVGRLERRKGVLEWIDAATAVAREDSTVRFEFVGPNVLGLAWISGEDLVEQRIAPEVRDRFAFHGSQPRTELPRFLGAARIAVVPSRWENFPNTCVEAMASGLPVLATRQGGMAEMIEDGVSGWLADDATPETLAGALRRALATPPERLREMGRNAAAAVARICDNRTILERHLALRAEAAARGASRSLVPPAGAPRTLRQLAEVGLADRQRLLATLPRPLRKALRSPRLAVSDTLKALRRLAGRETS
ncbi:MAG TPA: glycosyltransferase family 4 protein [Thermoanaerobaculia bacterium]|nr:glycosyltransferase family 4 protein [Thermoanaerobaculia bacterium]